MKANQIGFLLKNETYVKLSAYENQILLNRIKTI
jgi:hypothetical protein